jgi:molybdopterin synthase sulfur carrier subunit
MIKVLFFAQLREQLGCDSLDIDNAGLNNLTDLRESLNEQHPEWGSYLCNRKLLVAVNQTLVKFEHPIYSGDEVAFFPPVTGG